VSLSRARARGRSRGWGATGNATTRGAYRAVSFPRIRPPVAGSRALSNFAFQRVFVLFGRPAGGRGGRRTSSATSSLPRARDGRASERIALIVHAHTRNAHIYTVSFVTASRKDASVVDRSLITFAAETRRWSRTLRRRGPSRPDPPPRPRPASRSALRSSARRDRPS